MNDETDNKQKREGINVDGGVADDAHLKSFSSLGLPSSSSSTLFRNVRILPRHQRNTGQQVFELQTSVTTFERNLTVSIFQRVDVHAQVHFGCREYFDYFNTPLFRQNQYDAVHYELLVDESLLSTDETNGIRYISPKHNNIQLMASPYDQQMARQYGLCCQVDVIDYTQRNWIHSDLTRQELLAAISTSSDSSNNNNNKPAYISSWWKQQQESQQQQQQQPLWALASSAPTWPGVEAAVALLRPLTPSLSLSTPVVRRLFSNLFLPGTTLTAGLRAMFWLTLPCPELSVLLLDWSSLWPPPSGTLSPIALPVLECLLTGNIRSARQLILAQMLVLSQQQQQQQHNHNNPEPLLIGRRNDHAWNTITTTSLQKRDRIASVAVLYGISHIPDLTRRLIENGFVPVQTRWRTAWSVIVPSSMATNAMEQQDHGTPGSAFIALSSSTSSSKTALAVGLVLLPLYFAIGGWDWISTLQDVVKELEATHMVDAGMEVILYLIRHALLYLGLAKFVVEWDTNNKGQ